MPTLNRYFVIARGNQQRIHNFFFPKRLSRCHRYAFAIFVGKVTGSFVSVFTTIAKSRLNKILFFCVAVIQGAVFAADPIPMSEADLIYQLKYSTRVYLERHNDPDEPAPNLGHCPNSNETTNKGLSRNTTLMFGYASAFYEGIQLLKSNPDQSTLVNDMKDLIVRMGDDALASAIKVDNSKMGWNNLSSDWDAYGNGSCLTKTMPNLFGSAKALMVLYWAFETTTDTQKKKKYFDAFVDGVNYWMDNRSAILLDGQSYVITVDGVSYRPQQIKDFYKSKPNNEILKLAIVGGQRTDHCPGPGCTEKEKILNRESLNDPAVFTLPRPFRFHYGPVDPAMVAVNCSADLGLAMLKMGLALEKMNDPAFPMPSFDVPLSTRDGSGKKTIKKSLLYIGYWTIYSTYYNLAQKTVNASYHDVDTLFFAKSRSKNIFEAHLGTITAPVLAEAGALLGRQDYLDAAARSVRENRSYFQSLETNSYSPSLLSYCTMRNLDPYFSQKCSSLIETVSRNSRGARQGVSAVRLGAALIQGIVPVANNFPESAEITITQPLNGAVLNGPDLLKVAASYFDALKVEFIVNGRIVATDTSRPFTADLANLTPGYHRITAKAYDHAGNSVISNETVIFIKDKTSPTPNALPFSDDFQTEAAGTPPSKWLVEKNDQTDVVVSPTVFSGASGKSAYLFDDNAHGHCHMKLDTGGPVRQVYYRAKYRFRETKTSHYALLGNGIISDIYFLNAHGDGTWRYHNGSSYVRFSGDTNGYLANRWYNVEVLTDFAKKSFSVWVDRVLIGDNLPIPGENSFLTGMRLMPASALETGGMWVDDVSITSILPFYDNFESDAVGLKPARWEVVNSSTQNSVKVVLLDGKRSVSLVDKTKTGHAFMQYQTNQPVTKFYYRANYRFDETNTSHYALLGTGDAKTIYFINAHNDGTWRYFDGSKYVRFPNDVKGYNAKEWYRVEVQGDFATKKYSAWVNGVLVGDKITVPGNNSSFSAIRLQPTSDSGVGTMWVDNVLFEIQSGGQMRTAMANAQMPMSDGSSPRMSIDQSRAYPVPFRPGHGAYGITFDHMPDGVSVKLYTSDGRSIKTLTTNVSGSVLWDLTNEEGSPVASGVYIALIEKDGSNKKLKVVVQK